MKLLWTCIFACCVLSLGPRVSSAQDPLPKPPKQRVIIGGDDDYPPYQFLDKSGQPAGFNVDLAKAVARIIDADAVFRLGEWPAMKEALLKGKIDVLLDMSWSEDRARLYDFSSQAITVSYAIFTRKNTVTIHSLEDLVNKEVIIQSGDVLEDYSIRHMPLARLVPMVSPYDALKALASGKYDCSIQAELQGLYTIREHGLTNLTTVGPTVLETKNCFAVKKGNSILVDKINEALVILRQTGKYKAIYDKWFGALEPRTIPFVSMIKDLSLILVPLLLLLGGAIAWSWLLKNQVAQKTRDLQTELAERKRAQEALRESEQRYKSLVDNIDLGISLIDANYRVVMTNAAHDKLFDKPARYFLNNLCYRISAKGRSEVCPDCPGKEAMETGKTVDRESQAVCKNGTSFPLRIRAFPVMDSEGKASGFIEVVEDITERKRAEERLKRHAYEVFTLLNSLPGYAFYKDPNSVFVTVNKKFAEAVNISQEKIAGKTDYDLFPRELAEKFRADDKRVIESGEIFEVGEEFMREGDNSLTVATRKVPIKDDAGKVIGLIGLAFDITEMKRVEEEQRKLEAQIQHTQKLESLGVLAGGIAHDFNNLLMGILGNAELGLVGMSPLSPVYNRIEEIKKASIRASELTKQMLAYSGKGKFVVEPVNLNDLIEEMAHLLRVSISKKVVIKYDFMKELPLIEADVTQIRQVIMNLITNASDAIGERSGVISLRTGLMEVDRSYLKDTYLDDHLPSGMYVFVEVSDTGCGMDEKTKARIFDPFFTTKFVGRGLGLAAVLGIMRGHNGAIKVYSEPGKGTTFKALFPCSNQALEALAKPSKDKLKGWMGHGTILIVDDEEVVRSVAKSMLSLFGFNVIMAEDGREGVAVFAKHASQIDLVLLDMTMPHMDGVEAFREIRAIRPDARVILVSGYNEQDATNHFTGKGLAGFVQKPFQLEVLILKVREVMSGREPAGE